MQRVERLTERWCGAIVALSGGGGGPKYDDSKKLWPAFYIFSLQPPLPQHYSCCSLPSTWTRHVSCPERLERGGPYWQLKLRWMGTQRIQMKDVLPLMVRWAFVLCLAAPVGPVQNIFYLAINYTPSKLGRQPCWVACLCSCPLPCQRLGRTAAKVTDDQDLNMVSKAIKLL